MREKIKSILEKRNISVYRLAKSTGIPQGTLNNWFRGETDLGSSKLEKICEALGLELRESKRKSRITRPVDFIVNIGDESIRNAAIRTRRMMEDPAVSISLIDLLAFIDAMRSYYTRASHADFKSACTILFTEIEALGLESLRSAP